MAVQGLGNVGWHLCQHAAEDGAELIVADIDETRANKAVATFGAIRTEPSAIHAVKADIFAPCALGAGLNAGTIPSLCCEIVGGAANNQLAHDDLGEQLRRNGVLYAPDFVINAGGMIRVASERGGFDQDLVDRRVQGIGATLLSIFEQADLEKTSTHAAALRVAHERLRAARARPGGELAA